MGRLLHKTDSTRLIRELEREYARAPGDRTLRTRIDAVLSLLTGGSLAAASRRAGVSGRTIQQWARLVRERGADALGMIKVRGRPTRLTPEQTERLRSELERNPREFGYAQKHWTGSLLRQHISCRHGVLLSERRCRGLRVPAPLEGVAPIKVNDQRDTIGRTIRLSPGPRRFVLSDHELKRRALKRFQRLGFSGLPLYPFARCLFEITEEVIQQPEHNTLILDPRFKKTLFVNYPTESLGARFIELATSPESTSGFRFFPVLSACQKPLIAFREFLLPNYRSGMMYHEIFVPLQVEDSLFVILRDLGSRVGYYPVDRTPSMRPFRHDDQRFFEVAAPHIACGLKTALSITNAAPESGEFVQLDGKQGVVLLTADCRVLALDNNARSIFQRMGALDGLNSERFGANNVKRALAYIAHIVRSLLFENPDRSLSLPPPVARVYSHHSGIVLSLRGFLANGESAKYFTVIVEQGETRTGYRKRLMYRYGLSSRETEVLSLLTARLKTNEIAQQMHISRETVKTCFRRLIDKLALDGQASLVRFANDKKACDDH